MRTSSIFPVLFLTVGFTTITTTLPSASSNFAFAQTSSMSEGKILSENSISQVNVLFVNPSIGNDTQTDNSESAPFKTITKALQVAQGNTVIQLAPGTYSTETGEQFPLIVKQNLSIQGDVRGRGKGIIIQGGGEYLSRFYGSKNIGIVATGNSKIAGVTLTNPNRRGYGLWIESNQPVVEKNTFTNSTQDGVAVTGKAAPTISDNYFYSNGANGITVSGTSQPKIEQNTFQDTGFGINIAQNASPQIISNKISQNRSGVVVQASSSPVLRNNSIANNKEDGLVVIAQATPDLGSSSSPGGNQFSFNGRYDINAEAAKQEVAAYGNTINNKRIAGKVNITASAAPAKATISQPPQRKPTLFDPSQRRQNTARSQQPTASTTTNTESQFNYIEVQPDTNTANTTDAIEFTAPQASQPIAPRPTQPANTPSSLPTLQPAPIGESALLQVPQAKIPSVGNSASPLLRNPNQNQPRAANLNSLRYRVIVEAVSARQQELVKFIVPDAFRTIRRGKRVMQAGIFSNRNKARNLVRQFKNNGLKARIESMR